MSTLQITARDFREKQKDYFDLADKGEKVIIKRGSNKAYMLTPIDLGDLLVSPKVDEIIIQSLNEVKEGTAIKIEGVEELQSYLDSL